MNTYLRSLYFCFFLVPFVALGQDVYLKDAPYNVTWRDTTTIGQKFFSYEAAKASPALKDWIGYMEFIGQQSKVMSTRYAPACHNNIAWATDGYQQGPAYYQDGCTSRANIYWPHGAWWIDTEMIQTQGSVEGRGTGGFIEMRAGGVYLGGAGGTTWVYDEKGWDGVGRHAGVLTEPISQAKRFLLKDQTFGLASNFGYTEACHTKGIKVYGMSADLYEPAKHFSAFGVWKRGEDSKIENCFVYNCNDYGIEAWGDYHATLITDMVTIFGCNRGAYGIVGGAHASIDHWSCDENPWVVDIFPDPQGGCGNGSIIQLTNAGKGETGKGDGIARKFSVGQGLVNSEGCWAQITVSGGMYSMNRSALPEVLFRIKNTQGNVSWIEVRGLAYFYSAAYLLHDVNNKIKYKQTGIQLGSEAHSWTWNSNGIISGEITAAQTVTNVSEKHLAPIKIDPNTGQQTAQWDHVAGTPAFSYTTPIAGEGGPVVPPPTGTPCTGWSTGTWSTCTNGQQTRTVVPAPGGCNTIPPTAKPAESQTCTVTPGTWTELWKGTTVTKSTCTPVANKVATQVRLTNWKPSAGGRIVGTGVGKPSVELWNGDFYFNNAKCTSSVGKITLGQLYPSVTITLPKDASGNAIQITIVAAWQVKCESTFSYDGACPGQCTKLEAQ